jgi:hypothetical protein
VVEEEEGIETCGTVLAHVPGSSLNDVDVAFPRDVNPPPDNQVGAFVGDSRLTRRGSGNGKGKVKGLALSASRCLQHEMFIVLLGGRSGVGRGGVVRRVQALLERFT